MYVCAIIHTKIYTPSALTLPIWRMSCVKRLVETNINDASTCTFYV